MTAYFGRPGDPVSVSTEPSPAPCEQSLAEDGDVSNSEDSSRHMSAQGSAVDFGHRGSAGSSKVGGFEEDRGHSEGEGVQLLIGLSQ